MHIVLRKKALACLGVALYLACGGALASEEKELSTRPILFSPDGKYALLVVVDLNENRAITALELYEADKSAPIKRYELPEPKVEKASPESLAPQEWLKSYNLSASPERVDTIEEAFISYEPRLKARLRRVSTPEGEQSVEVVGGSLNVYIKGDHDKIQAASLRIKNSLKDATFHRALRLYTAPSKNVLLIAGAIYTKNYEGKSAHSPAAALLDFEKIRPKIFEKSYRAKALNDAGAKLLKKNKPKEALEKFEEAMKLDPKLSQPIYNAAKTYALLEDETASLLQLEKLMGLNAFQARKLLENAISDPEFESVKNNEQFISITQRGLSVYASQAVEVVAKGAPSVVEDARNKFLDRRYKAFSQIAAMKYAEKPKTEIIKEIPSIIAALHQREAGSEPPPSSYGEDIMVAEAIAEGAIIWPLVNRQADGGILIPETSEGEGGEEPKTKWKSSRTGEILFPPFPKPSPRLKIEIPTWRCPVGRSGKASPKSPPKEIEFPSKTGSLYLLECKNLGKFFTYDGYDLIEFNYKKHESIINKLLPLIKEEAASPATKSAGE